MSPHPGALSSQNPVRTYWANAVLAVALLLSSGCVVWAELPDATVETPPAYKEAGNFEPAQPNEQNLGGTWWTIFQDSQLDALEAQVDVSNQNLKAAQAQYQQARAVLRYSPR